MFWRPPSYGNNHIPLHACKTRDPWLSVAWQEAIQAAYYFSLNMCMILLGYWVAGEVKAATSCFSHYRMAVFASSQLHPCKG